ncbi:cytochrome c biogenesis protein CcdA [Lentimicrobium sp.]|jgi:thiol:disulfide interchange protein DsbD|uniref:protein-disulfide reductase DsbD family protein n=2 Tax=Lentimicrobium sp. TaxID=2034841 RepID=UPI002C139082|nr:cytochrome c biogenesis protein CcdA [Lentimicrobium sp.]HPF63305.1 cytochrome c biogenesis protein CcdA [Lentimicrobium sp.]HPR26422.1 cytochrome c biogenesis protein CcdA [Lentimicrobium sp.]HRW68015.1 cytochrome c biogenesis protein CcdA [Lentimicrobium sp.]
MKKFQKLLLLLLIILGSSVTAFPQVLKPVKWSFTTKQISNSEAQLIFTATIEPAWHLYSQDIPPDGPVPTSFTFEPGPEYKLIGKVKEPKAKEEFDKNFDMVVKYFADKAVFTQKIEVLTDKDFVIKGFLEFMCCDDSRCLPPDEVDFEFRVKGNPDAGKKTEAPAVIAVDTAALVPADTVVASAVADTVAQDTGEINPDEAGGLEEHSSLWALFFFSFIAGLAAILTPCVFPMIPMTVTFFLKEKDKVKAKFQALTYGFSIILIYTVIGTVVAITLGANFANFLSTHWLPNILFFLIFMFFAASFLGMFEITLPSWLINKSDSQADRGGIVGSFFMAFTLVLVSFSCTGPIVGAILVASASGQVLEPIIGMLGFSLAFALPFTLFAFFPRWLNNMPKSGGWLNSVKVVLGFIELALGLKFLSIADQTYHWGILDREVYLAFWIVIFTLMGFYLLGKLKFSHDSDLKFISVPRLSLAIITFTFVLYMIPGMFGAPLQALSGYLPPQSTHDFDLNKIVRDNVQVFGGGGGMASEKPTGLCDKPKHGELLHLPHGLEGYFDYEQGLACAAQQNKPVFIDFTGHGCVNCREMEARVWSDPRVLKKLREEFIIVALYVDDKTQLPESEWITSTYDGKVKKTIGKKYADFQISRFNVNAQPYYVLLDTKGNTLVPPKAYDLDVENFMTFLEAGLAEFKARQ